MRGHRARLRRARAAARPQVHPHQRAAAYARRVLGVLGIGTLFDGVIAIEDMRMFGHLRPKPDARMLRRAGAQAARAAARCVLVEDTLDHQKAARRVGMRTVWMQRYARRAASPAPSRAHGSPPGRRRATCGSSAGLSAGDARPGRAGKPVRKALAVSIRTRQLVFTCRDARPEPADCARIARPTEGMQPRLFRYRDPTPTIRCPGERSVAEPRRNGRRRPARKRPKPGERRVQILQTLATMLEQPGADRITTAALAASSTSAKPRCTATSPARRRCSKG